VGAERCNRRAVKLSLLLPRIEGCRGADQQPGPAGVRAALADPAAGIEGEETPEGHLVRYDAAGTLAGVTILGARRILDRDGAITITLPQRVEAAVIAPALAQAS